MNLYIMCGLPGSGKSTWAKEMVETESCLCVSRDAIRTMLGCGKYIFDPERTEPIVKYIAHNGIKRILMISDVIIDETNLTKRKRLELIDLAISVGAEPVIIHCCSTSGNVDRRMADDPRGYSREKWESVVAGMMASYEPPTEEECKIIKIEIGQ